MSIYARIVGLAFMVGLFTSCDAPEVEENRRSGAVSQTASQDANQTLPSDEPSTHEDINNETSENNEEDDVDVVVATEEMILVDEPTPSPTPEIIIQTQYQAIEREGSVIVEQDNNGVSVRLLSSAQLRNSIGSCIAPDMTHIAAPSIIALTDETASNPSTSNAFLLPIVYAPGDDIISHNRELLDGPQSQVVTGTRNANLSLSYLTGLRLIANVVAHNCELSSGDDDSLVATGCACSTYDQASDMLSRCMPQYNMTNGEHVDLIESFAESCASDPKEAIASLLSSIGFVRIP